MSIFSNTDDFPPPALLRRRREEECGRPRSIAINRFFVAALVSFPYVFFEHRQSFSNACVGEKPKKAFLRHDVLINFTQKSSFAPGAVLFNSRLRRSSTLYTLYK
jgi:hypothetical protein